MAVMKGEAANYTVTYNSVDITGYINQSDLEGRSRRN